VNLQSIIAELQNERDRIDRAIAVLNGTATANTAIRKNRASTTKRSVTSSRKSGGHLTAAGRKRLSQLMKKRWAERRRKASNGRKPAAKAA
jgi:hypothetical protein